jgi:type II secretory pathway pseudopilin PulG
MRRTARGITLVELIVVMAIVAAILAVLLPVSSTARERGRQAVCLSNLRQIGQALTMYRQDYSSYPQWETPFQALSPYVKNHSLFYCPLWVKPVGIDSVASYRYLLDGDRMQTDGTLVGPRSVIIFCDYHRRTRHLSWKDIHTGSYTVLRQDGAAEVIPVDKVQETGRRMPNREPWFGGVTTVLKFPE